MNEIEDAWNERNPDAAFTSPVASQEDDDDDYYSSRYNTQDSQDSTVEGYDRDDNTAATAQELHQTATAFTALDQRITLS